MRRSRGSGWRSASTLPGAWSVAHYVELRGDIDPILLGRAIVTGLSQADTLSMRFAKITAKHGSGSMNIVRLPNRITGICVPRATRTRPRWR